MAKSKRPPTASNLHERLRVLEAGIRQAEKRGEQENPLYGIFLSRRDEVKRALARLQARG